MSYSNWMAALIPVMCIIAVLLTGIMITHEFEESITKPKIDFCQDAGYDDYEQTGSNTFVCTKYDSSTGRFRTKEFCRFDEKLGWCDI